LRKPLADPYRNLIYTILALFTFPIFPTRRINGKTLNPLPMFALPCSHHPL
jgi:hypothetical protein